MVKSKRWPVYVAAGSGLHAGTLVWTRGSKRFVTLVAKARLALVHEGYASLAEPSAPRRQDVHRDGHPMKSLAEAADMAPRKPAADVVLLGHAQAGATTATEMQVRLAVYRDNEALIDKRCRVVGDRKSETDAPEPFERMPLTFERSVGGASHPVNPVGVGGKPGAALPNLLLEAEPNKPAALGPLAALWRNRQFKLPEDVRRALRNDPMVVPSDLDWDYFQVALESQRCSFLRGDEWIFVEGMHPQLARIQTRLPYLCVQAQLGQRGQVEPLRRAIDMLIDTVNIDADAMHMDVVWRGSAELEQNEDTEALAAVAVLSQHGQEADFQSVYDEVAKLAAPATKPAFADLGHTVTPDALPANFFPFPVAKREVQEQAPRAREEPRPAVVEPPPASASEPLSPPAVVATPVAVPPPEATPVPVSAEILPDEPAEIRKPAGMLAGTFYLSPEAMGEAEPSLPFAAEEEKVVSARGRMHVESDEIGPPPDFDDRGESVPVVRAAPLHLVSYPWQRQPDSPELVVAIKGSFDLVAQKPARLREESEYPDGDHFWEGDLEASLIRASDYAIQKPQADVLLLGTAYAAQESTDAMQVVFRFGELGRDASGFERRMNVFGDRYWRSGRMSKPAAFEQIPLRYELAYGGPDFAANPVGCGRQFEDDKPRRLPNLEWANAPIRQPTDAPEPAGFGPLAPMWQERMQHVGSYGQEWLDTRWPYFPADFNYAFFNAAPPAQRLATIVGDESYRIQGMRPEGASVAGELPKLRVRCFAQYNKQGGGQFRELSLALDTCTFDMDDMRLDLVWRGRIAVSHDTAPELQAFFVLAEHLDDTPMAIVEAAKHYRASVMAMSQVDLEDVMQVTAANDDAGVMRESAAARLRAEEQRRADRLVTFLPFAGKAGAEDKDKEESEADQRESEALKRERLAAFMLLYESNESLVGLNLSYLDLRQLDLSHRDMQQCDLQYTQLGGADLTGTNLLGAQLGGADMSGCILDQAELEAADLTGAILDDASLVAADFEDTDLSGVRAHRADFTNSIGDDAIFAEADLSDAQFVNVAMANLDLSDARLDRCNFSDANLSDLRLYAARGTGLQLLRSDLSAARADDCVLQECQFDDALLAESTWENADLSGSSFHRCDLRGSSFVATNCERAIFGQSDLREAQFRRAKLEGANLIQVNALGASFEEAILRDVDLRKSNLHGVETWKAQVGGVALEGALVSNSRFEKKS